MNRKNIALLSALGFACAGLSLVPAQAEAPQTIAKLNGGSCPVVGKCSIGPKGMNLTDDQLEKLSTMKVKAQEVSDPLKLKLKSLRHEMMDKLTAGDASKAEILELQTKINGLRSELANNRVSFMVDASAVLTSEQKQKMRRKMLMKNLMGKKFHGKRMHGKMFPGKRMKKMKAGVEAESGVTIQAESSITNNGLG